MRRTPWQRSGPPAERERERRPRRPFWARGLSDQEYQALIEKRELHGLALAMSTESSMPCPLHDLWLRFVIVFLAGLSAFGCGLAWRNLAKNSELQIRLVRASELNTHLKEMNLAAAGFGPRNSEPAEHYPRPGSNDFQTL